MNASVKWLSGILGVPPSAAELDLTLTTLIGSQSPEEALRTMVEGMQHNTHKSGALLGAQGVFVVVDTFAIDHGWPRGLVLTALLIMLAGAMLVMTNLRNTAAPFRADGAHGRFNAARAAFSVLLYRAARFNVALYLTFLSIALLAIASLSLA